MKISEAFVIGESREVLWEFFEQVDRVAACLPGVEEVVVVDSENSRVRVAQSIGPMSVTLDIRMQVTERVPLQTMRFVATGRSVKGAAGNVRAVNVVNLEEAGEGATRVVLDADIALGGMMGSVGQKVVAKQARKITQSFAATLERELRGEPAALPASTATAEATDRLVAPGGEPGSGRRQPTVVDGAEPGPGSDDIVIRVPRGAISHGLAAAAGALVAAGVTLLWRRRAA